MLLKSHVDFIGTLHTLPHNFLSYSVLAVNCNCHILLELWSLFLFCFYFCFVLLWGQGVILLPRLILLLQVPGAVITGICHHTFLRILIFEFSGQENSDSLGFTFYVLWKECVCRQKSRRIIGLVLLVSFLSRIINFYCLLSSTSYILFSFTIAYNRRKIQYQLLYHHWKQSAQWICYSKFCTQKPCCLHSRPSESLLLAKAQKTYYIYRYAKLFNLKTV